MKRTGRRHEVLSKGQLEVMDVVWDKGEATVADVWQTLGERRRLARNTVLTIMTRLEEKGWLTRRLEGNTFVYSAKVERETTHKNLLGWLLDTAFKGSTEGLVMALLQHKRLDKDEAANLQRMIAEAEATATEGQKGRRERS